MVVIAQVAGLQMQEQQSELEAKVLEISHTREHDCLEKPPTQTKEPTSLPQPPPELQQHPSSIHPAVC